MWEAVLTRGRKDYTMPMWEWWSGRASGQPGLFGFGGLELHPMVGLLVVGSRTRATHCIL